MPSRSIRWLHLSDFHVGKDEYAQRSIFDKIIDHVKSKLETDFMPDFLFLVGDLADRGKPEEYEEFVYKFLLPLQQVVGDGIETRTYAVPGNHDVSRLVYPAFNREEMAEPKSRYFDPSSEGCQLRKMLIPRFAAYAKHDVTAKSSWLDTESGAYSEIHTCRGIRVGIGGINTAWLSKDDKDNEKLTPGKPLLESLLEHLKESDLRIILGHHPLDWLIPQEEKMIKALLGKTSAIYLHGHLHEIWAEPSFGSGNAFLAVQTAASFQARENEIWRNGLLWGEADTDTQILRLQPWNWIAAHQNWALAADAFPEVHRKGEFWEYILPGTEKARAQAKASAASGPAVPAGWMLEPLKNLSSKTGPLEVNDATRFFDGAVPDWNIALSCSIPRRDIVQNLVNWFLGHMEEDRSVICLLLGAGCEGKTTAILQAALSILEHHPNWMLLRRVDETLEIHHKEMLATLEKCSPCLVVIDEADRVARSLYDLVQRLGHLRGKVHFLLACRDTDWISSRANELTWASISSFHRETLRGLKQKDADAIVTAWSGYGQRGLRDLEQFPEPDRSFKLVEAARSQVNSADGAFFGALLQVRLGSDLFGHARLMLERLSQRRLSNGRTLRDALGYIALMHAEGLEFLSRPVLAMALDSPLEKIRKDVLIPLGNEAAATATSDFIFTRHRNVAKAVISVLSDDFGEDLEMVFLQLADAAMRASQTNYIPDLGFWRYRFPQYLFDTGRVGLSLQVARSILNAEPHNLKTLTKVASLYRDAGAPAEGVHLFRELPVNIAGDRAFYLEWAITEGTSGEQWASAVLLAYSIADQAPEKALSNDQAKQSLASLGIALGNLFIDFKDVRLLNGQAAVAVLGNQLRLDRTTASYFNTYLNNAKALGAEMPTSDKAFLLLDEAITATAKQDVPSIIISRLGDPARFTFVRLQTLIRSMATDEKN